MRHRAWLAARPGKGAGRPSRLETYLKDEEAGNTRSELVLPEIEAWAYVVDYLFAVGPSTGGEVLTFQEIAAWSALTGRVLGAWEAETLKALSGAYLSEYHAAEDVNRPPPFRPAERVVPRAEVSSRLLAMYQAMAEQDAKSGLGAKPAARPSRRPSSRGSDGPDETPQQ